MRFIFFGMHGPLSQLPLDHLLRSGLELAGVVISAAPELQLEPVRKLPAPRAGSVLPLLGQQARYGIVEMAWERGVPALSLSRLGAAETVEALAALEPDLACVSCFPRRIPPALLALPRLGFLNLHPSALPEHRGPAPIFWQLREGRDRLGLSVHLMDSGFDSGPLLAQSWLALSDGMRGAEIDAACGDAGGALLARAALDLAGGTASPRAQPGGGSYQGWPRDRDFRLDTAWPARQAYNFMRGTRGWEQARYIVESGERRCALSEALGYEDNRRLEAPLVQHDDRFEIQFEPGVLRARGVLLQGRGEAG